MTPQCKTLDRQRQHRHGRHIKRQRPRTLQCINELAQKYGRRPKPVRLSQLAEIDGDQPIYFGSLPHMGWPIQGIFILQRASSLLAPDNAMTPADNGGLFAV